MRRRFFPIIFPITPFFPAPGHHPHHHERRHHHEHDEHHRENHIKDDRYPFGY